MVDPLAEVVTLLQPSPGVAKVVSAAGTWRVRRSEAGRPFYCVVIAGICRLQLEGRAPISLRADDFVLIPETHDFEMSSLEPPPSRDGEVAPVVLPSGEIRHGTADGQPEVVLLVGHCAFDSPDAALLVSLLPSLVHVRGERRLCMLVDLVGEESRARRAGRDMILSRLLEVLLMEAFRTMTAVSASPGLLRGLADGRLAIAVRLMHEDPRRPWTVPELAKAAALSRSVFFDRFRRAVGLSPMEYLLAWRMALAKDMLRRKQGSVAEIAERVGYGSASTFSVAFTRHVGQPPTHFVRGLA